MDDYFDFERAKYVLSEYTKTRIKDGVAAPFLVYNKGSDIVKYWRASRPDKHGTSHMMYKDVESGDAIEAVMMVQGYILKQSLPPVRMKPKNASAAKFLRQSVTIVGVGSSVFQDAVDSIQAAHSHLARNYAPGSMQSWLPDKFEGQAELSISNRYLTSRQRQSHSPVVAFQRGVDPHNIIAQLASDQYDHLEENRVMYYRLNSDCSKFEISEPSVFRIGDFVEANFSIIAVPVGQQLHRMQLVLRSLALLDGGQATTAEVRRQAAAGRNMPSTNEEEAPVIIRKRTFYEDEDCEAVSRNLKKMNTGQP